MEKIAQTPKVNGLVPHEHKPSKLPTIEELYTSDNLPVVRKDALFQVLVNQEPKKEWVKVHPMTKEPYIPIERVEWLLINIVGRYRVEIKDTKQIANSVTVTIRLHYFDQIHNEWTFHDGIGSAPLQTDKGAGAVDWNAIKSNAVQIGAPAAESYAIKDAAEKIGKIFGKDLNRKEVISYENLKDRYKNALEND
jgi:hypothetical protein